MGDGWVLGGLYRVPTRPVPVPVFSHILALRPYPRPYEGRIKVFHEVSQTGSRNGSRIDPELTRIDPRFNLPDWSRDGPRYDLRTLRSTLSHTAVWNRALFNSLLTVAEVFRVSSKDWIRAPTRSQE